MSATDEPADLPRAVQAPVSDPTQRVQPSTGIVLPPVEPETTGVLDPTFYQGLDVQSAGRAAEETPQPPQNELELDRQQREKERE